MKIIHSADFHLGFNAFREEKDFDPFKSLRYVVDYAIQHKADILLLVGDIFDRRDPPSFIQRGFAREIRRLLNKNITVFIVPGNHDGSPNPERDVHLDVYNALQVEGVFIAKKIRRYRFKGVNIISVPYPYKKNLLSKEQYRNKSEGEIVEEINSTIINAVKSYLSEIGDNSPAILAAHIPIAEGKVGSERYLAFSTDMPILLNQLDIKGLSYVALGHLHTMQIFTTLKYAVPVVYSGSIDRINFSEENDEKGFFEVDINSEGKVSFHFVENPSARKFYSIKVKRSEDILNVNFERIRESITRIVIFNDIEDETAFKKFIEKVKKEALVFTGIEDKRDFSNKFTFSKAGVFINPEDAVKKYIEEKQINDKFIEKEKEEIIKTAKKLLEEAKEQ